MKVGELKKRLINIDDNLEVIIEMIVDEVERNEGVSHIETNDSEFYLVGESAGFDI